VLSADWSSAGSLERSPYACQDDAGSGAAFDAEAAPRQLLAGVAPGAPGWATEQVAQEAAALSRR